MNLLGTLCLGAAWAYSGVKANDYIYRRMNKKYPSAWDTKPSIPTCILAGIVGPVLWPIALIYAWVRL